MNVEESDNGIFLKTLKSFYFPGELLHGYIYLRIRRPLKVSRLSLKIEGKEYTFWRTRNPPGEFERENSIYDNTQPIKPWADNIVPSGDHSIPFEMVLGEFIPVSFGYESALGTESEQRAYIRYKIKAELIFQDNSTLEVTQDLNIRENSRSGNPPQIEKTVRINCSCFFCCSFSKGQTRIKCNFDKNSYESGEEAQLKYEINNNNCSLPIQSVKARLFQEMELSGLNKETRVPEDARNVWEVLSETLPGVNANQAAGKGPGSGIFSMRLLRSAEGQRQSLQPSVEGVLIRCKYYLQVEMVYGGRWLQFPDEQPIINVPVNISGSFPQTDANLGTFPDFNPKNYQAVPILLNLSNILQTE